MAVQRLILIHPRELEIPTKEEINPVAKMKTPRRVRMLRLRMSSKKKRTTVKMLLPTAKIQEKLSRGKNQKNLTLEAL